MEDAAVALLEQVEQDRKRAREGGPYDRDEAELDDILDGIDLSDLPLIDLGENSAVNPRYNIPEIDRSEEGMAQFLYRIGHRGPRPWERRAYPSYYYNSRRGIGRQPDPWEE